MINDFSYIFYWWFLLFVLGLSFLPLTWFLFRKFFDKGYAFSKIIAILLISYAIWLLGSLRLLPFLAETTWLIVFAFTAGNIFLLSKKRQEFKREINKNWKIFAFEEFLFLFCLLSWSFIRGFQPNIQGLEKFMDYGFVNSIFRARFFPPVDMWLAGETINYYYFGHLMTAVLTKLSGIDPAITYNLMIATIFALCSTASFSLGGNLIFMVTRNTRHATRKRSKFKIVFLAGLLTAFLLTLGGNLHPLYWFLTHGNFKSYWYPDATRFIVEKFGAADNTIHEFPIYSFVVADLHGHMINIPNVLLILALVFSVSLGIYSKKKLKQLAPQILLLSFCFAVAFMTNAWDYPIYLLATGGVVLLFNKNLAFGENLVSRCARNKLKSNWDKALIRSGTIGGFLVAGSLLLSLPFHLRFKSIAKGIALSDFHSPPWMFLILWGLPLFTTTCFFVFLATAKTRKRAKAQNPADYFILVLLTLSWFLILIPEIIYVKDIYIHTHQRANTVFKLTYQSFVMFAIAGGYIIIRILTALKTKFSRFLFFILYSLFFIPILIYPYFATRSYYDLKTYQGLYGLNYLKRSYPDDYQAILWLNKNIPNQPTIVEAVGESYTDFARVSTNTGLPTILGWRVHEWLWRGSFEEPGERTEEVRQIYESENLEETKKLLEKYEVKYLFLGNLERKQYPNLSEEKFNQLGRIVFSSNKTKIYQF